MNRDAVFAIVSEVLYLEPGVLKGDERLKDLDGWDSLAVVSFMSGMDEKLGLMIEPEELARCVTVNDLTNLAASA